MLDNFFTGQKGPDAIKKLNELWAAYIGGGGGTGGGGATADLTTLNAAVAAANASATAASASATTASNAVAAVQTAATSANDARAAVAASALAAASSATGAATSATTASTAATGAATSATTASTAATNATASATTSSADATGAAASASAAASSASAAAASAAAAAVSAGTPPPASAPAPVTALTFSGATASGMTLTWNAAATATGYNVYRDGAKLTPTPQPGTSFTATGLTPSTQYTWIVRAVNAAGESANTTLAATTTGATVPTQPLGLVATAPTSAHMTLKWNAVSGATGYNIFRNTSGTIIQANGAPTTILEFTDSGLAPSTSYGWIIRAVNATGEGPPSAAVHAVTTGLPINGLTPLATRLLAGYFEAYDPQYNITSAPAAYGLIFLYNAQPWAPGITGSARDNIGDGTFSFPNVGEAQVSAASIQAVRARGQKVVVTFGGPNANFNFDTRTKSDNFIASVKTILASMQIPANGAAFGADGIDLNTFQASIRDLSKATPSAVVNYPGETLYIAQQLRAFYGANFILTLAPTPDVFLTPNFAPLEGQITKLLSDNGVLNVVSPKYYEFDRYKLANVIKDYHVQWVSLLSGRQQEVGIGMGNHRTVDTPTLAENQRELAAILTLYPNLRMVFGWKIQSDLNAGSAFSTAISAQLGVGIVTPPEQPPATGGGPAPISDAAVTAAFGFNGGTNGAALDAAAPNLRQGTTKDSAVVTLTGQRVGRIVDLSGNDNDVLSVAGGAALGTYRQVGAKHSVGFVAGLAGATGGGSGEGLDYYGFAASIVTEPQGTLCTIWTDKNGAFVGRELQYDAAQNGFVFSVGTGTTRERVVVGGLGTVNVAPPAGSRWLVDVWHEGNELSMRVDGGPVATAICPVFALGSVNFAIGGSFADAAVESGGFIDYSAHTISSLTPALRDDLAAYVQARMSGGTSTGGAVVTKPTLSTAASPTTVLQIGDLQNAYFVHDNRWNQGAIAEGPAADQFMQEVGVQPLAAADGGVALRMRGRWPDPLGSGEIKAYPEVSIGRKPGFYSGTDLYGGSEPTRLPDGSMSTMAPSGHTPGTFFPLQLPLTQLRSRTAFSHNAPPTGEGQLVYDIWLQNSAPQTGGFPSADITHEIMIPLDNWGGYGSHPNGRNPGWFDHSATIAGRLWHIYVNKGPDGVLRSDFAYLDGTHGRTGWKFIVFVPDTVPVAQNEVLDLAAMINYLATRVDSAGTKWVNGTEFIMGVEFGVEPKIGTFDITLWEYQVTR